MADGRHIEYCFSAISPRHIVRSMQNLECWSRITCWHMSHDQNSKFRKLKMANGRYFDNGYISISSNFDEIWCADAQFYLVIIDMWAILQHSTTPSQASFISAQWINLCTHISHINWLVLCLGIKKLTRSWRDPDGMAYRKGNNKTGNINMQTAEIRNGDIT